MGGFQSGSGNQVFGYEAMTALPNVTQAPIDGLLEIQLDIRGDARGWFEEVWNRSKWSNLGLPQFLPVQQNTSANNEIGVTRGLHAEPWNKLVTILSGRAFCAWVDLRPGPDFGRAHWRVLEAGQAVYVPRGVANGYQTLELNTVYSYLVDDHWSPEASYLNLNLFDTKTSIPWPIAKEKTIVSEKDGEHPSLKDLYPMTEPQAAIVGFSGQVGSELCHINPTALRIGRKALAGNPAQWEWGRDLELGAAVFNAAAFTSVDDAEVAGNWSEVNATNSLLPSKLSEVTKNAGATLVHFSSDYVFDGTSKNLLSEDSEPNPLNIYGRTKLLGDFGVMRNPRHYIIRTSWVYGSGRNFVDSIKEAASAHRELQVVSDQFGRPTSAKDIAKVAVELVNQRAPFGTYNYSGSGEVISWFELARFIYETCGADPRLVKPTSTANYSRGRTPSALRPRYSAFDLSKIQVVGIDPPDWTRSVRQYLENQR